jgi:hypothetical protein
MPTLRLAVVAVLALSAAPAAQTTVVGTWHAQFVGPIGPRPKMVDAVTFRFQSGPTGLTGTAKAEPEWPGDLDVSAITVDGDHLTFTGTGKVGSSSNGQYHCCPRLVFDGTIKGNQMALTMTWTSTAFPNAPAAPAVPMEATRVSTAASPRRP